MIYNEKTIWLRIPYAGQRCEHLVQHLTRKLKKCFKTTVKFAVVYQTTKMSSYCSVKDKLPKDQISNLIYKISCPGCGSDYIGKTDRNFITRMKEQGSRDNEPMFRHLSNCTKFHELTNMFSLGDDDVTINPKQHIYNAVLSNCSIVHRLNQWSQLCYLEAYYIKLIDPVINCGIRASKELSLFK